MKELFVKKYDETSASFDADKSEYNYHELEDILDGIKDKIDEEKLLETEMAAR